ncbi:hypothetical protein MF406_17720 [Georgenia sp. TF02-10]|uniref:YqeB family protein n=1 Tax=Georgenia sp. TF02-10 TaxID=2917725 RepID=UPI001FA71696|nr:hypothetical protein [Georgenia sp. TF02-10]UNX54687.1 hypothetical protein MF406_17720 [Georgenia sp. TF02-10]
MRAVAEVTTVGPPRHTLVAIGAGLPAIGIVAGLALALALEWLSQASPTIDGVLGRGDHLGEPVALIIGAALGAVVGAAGAAAALAERLRATVSPRTLTLSWDDARVSVPRDVITSVILDGDLVLHGPRSVELARVRCDVDRPALRAALAAHGYPEPAPEDPHRGCFRSWRAGQDLDRDADRLLAARARAVAARAHGDAELLRRRLAARGIMVRDVTAPGRHEVQQQWRTVELPELAA